MDNEISFISYSEMLKKLENNQDNHLLLGNGFNCSLGIYTRYPDIFQQMKINNPNYEKIIDKNFDLEEFIGTCKSQINKENNKYYDFMTTFFHNRIKEDFMRAVTEIVAKEVKNIFQEKNESIYLLLKNFNNFFTLNYDPFLYQLLMTYKKNDSTEKEALAFRNSLPFVKELMENEDKELYKIISQAYHSGQLTLSISDNTIRIDDLNKLKKSQFSQTVNNYLNDRHFSKSRIKKVIDKIWEENLNPNKKVIENIDDGFALFDNNLIYCHPETQNLFFLHGAFHIYKKGKSIYKISQTSDKALYEKIEEVIENKDENILCIFSDKNKLEEIKNEQYYLNCYNKLEKLEGNIVVIGCAFSSNDEHIFSQINKSKINNIYVTCFENEQEDFKQKLLKLFPNKRISLVDIKTITYN